MDALDYQHNDRTFQTCNKHKITVYRIPPNITAWLQPCDVYIDERRSILLSCDELHKAIHEMRSEGNVPCWMNIGHQTIDELKGKSARSSHKRSRSTPIPT